jgi:hypothetical protein
MNVKLRKCQVLMPWVGQKVVLSEAIDDECLVYPVGAIGTLESVSPHGAIVVFDDDPTKDLVDVGLDDFMPVEFMPEGYKLSKALITRSLNSNRI